jgi:cytochrome c-type biogenesis protein CcmH
MPLLFALLLALTTVQTPDPAALERTARQIETEVIAPCCWRQQVSIHSSPAAEEMKADIRRRLAEGQTHQEILDAYYEQYGARVLVVPPARGVSWLLYIIPPIVLLASAALVVVVVRRFTARRGAGAPAPAVAAAGAGSSPYDQRLNDELRDMD